MLTVGSLAPEIDALDQHGSPFRLSEQEGRLCTVIYFFPKAFTPGCTRETATFRDNYSEIHLAGAALAGVSTDDATTQCSFATSMKVEFPLLADPHGKITMAYDVRWPLIGIAQRATYIVGPGQRILGAFHHEFRVQKHRDDVLAFVDGLYLARQRAFAPR